MKSRRNLVDRRADPVRRYATTAKFDSETGQIFQETEVRFHERQRSDWIGEFKTPALLRRPRPNEYGARSLFDMANDKVARNFRRISAGHLTEIPWEVAEKVWRQIVSLRGETYHAWRSFAKAYPEDFQQPKHRYQLEIRQPPLPLNDYFRGLTSPTISWLTCVRISPKQVTSTDLISLAKIENLAILDLSDGQLTIDDTPSSFDERIVKTWAELATSEGAFTHLRALLLGWQSTPARWIFKYLDSFPSLCHVLLTDCSNMHQRNRADWDLEATKRGWHARHGKKSARSLRPILDDHTFYLGAVSGCYYESQHVFELLNHSRKPKVAARLPVVECWIGNPRPWTHIIEEFPGTRTVWLDNVKTTGTAQNDPDLPHLSSKKENETKRLRDADRTIPQGSRSPPSKRPQSRLKPKAPMKSAAEALAEFEQR